MGRLLLTTVLPFRDFEKFRPTVTAPGAVIGQFDRIIIEI